jgi:hypothetical protein
MAFFIGASLDRRKCRRRYQSIVTVMVWRTLMINAPPVISHRPVLINGVDTGKPEQRCTFADLVGEMIETCLADAKNHGRFVRCVSHETNILKRAKTITGKQKGKVQSLVAKMRQR